MNQYSSYRKRFLIEENILKQYEIHAFGKPFSSKQTVFKICIQDILYVYIYIYIYIYGHNHIYGLGSAKDNI